MSLEPEDVIVMYTDGISEATNPKGMFYGTKGVEKLLARGARDVETLGRQLMCDVEQFTAAARRATTSASSASPAKPQIIATPPRLQPACGFASVCPTTKRQTTDTRIRRTSRNSFRLRAPSSLRLSPSIAAADFLVEHLHDQRVFLRFMFLQLLMKSREAARQIVQFQRRSLVIEQLLGLLDEVAQGDE